MDLENIMVEDAEDLSKLDRNTIQHSDEINTERANNEALRKEWRGSFTSIMTADCAVYTVEDGEVVLYLTRGKYNLILNNFEEAIKQLKENGSYVPKKDELEKAINAETTLRIKISDLGKLRDMDSFVAFVVDPRYLRALNDSQRHLTERAYGQNDDLEKNIAALSFVEVTGIFLLNPDYVKTNVKEGGALVQPCCMANSSYFHANLNHFSHPLRAALKEETPKD